MRTRTALTLGLGMGTASALGTYIFAKPRLRKEMMEAESVGDAATALGTHIKKDALETTNQTLKAMRRHHFMRSLERRFSRAAAHANREVATMKHTVRKTAVKHHVKKAASHAKKAVQHTKTAAKTAAA